LHAYLMFVIAIVSKWFVCSRTATCIIHCVLIPEILTFSLSPSCRHQFEKAALPWNALLWNYMQSSDLAEIGKAHHFIVGKHRGTLKLLLVSQELVLRPESVYCIHQVEQSPVRHCNFTLNSGCKMLIAFSKVLLKFPCCRS
jgi:hypothetical protein